MWLRQRRGGCAAEDGSGACCVSTATGVSWRAAGRAFGEAGSEWVCAGRAARRSGAAFALWRGSGAGQHCIGWITARMLTSTIETTFFMELALAHVLLD